MSANFAAPLRTAIISNSEISDHLSSWEEEPAVFTRRPTPGDAKYPLVAISPDIGNSDFDGLKSLRTVTTKDILIFGEQPNQYRLVDDLSYLIRDMFHRKKESAILLGTHVISITALGPIVAPTEQEDIVGRLVSLTIFHQPA